MRVLTLMAALLTTIIFGVEAQSAGRVQSPTTTVSVAVSKGVLISLPEAAKTVFVADPEVASFQVAGERPGAGFWAHAGSDYRICPWGKRRPHLQRQRHGGVRHQPYARGAAAGISLSESETHPSVRRRGRQQASAQC